MTDVVAVPARDIGPDDFKDLVATAVTGLRWAEGRALQVTFDGTLTDTEVAAVRRRMCSASLLEEQLRDQAETFIAADPASVTLVQLVRVVQRLARLVLAQRGGAT